MHFLLKNAVFRKMHFSRKSLFFFLDFFFVMIEEVNSYLGVSADLGVLTWDNDPIMR